ncbi:lachesin-like [Limulus polyphemus]|uniref:Lachesin-like n=1 Tax=Limulus polyphemus TaxID=6850 RepID=A0ABM1SDR6_LIMPO|nr:lachesin-like [Limulus polyphemus]
MNLQRTFQCALLQSRWVFFLLQIISLFRVGAPTAIKNSNNDRPFFVEPVPNITVPVGRDVNIPCVVDSLGNYGVAWIKVEDKVILSIYKNVITRNYRVSLTHSDNKHFVLHIANIQESDRGGYMCQVNTTPMMSQTGYLDVQTPPTIVSLETDSNKTVREGVNITLRCRADGQPTPNITWRREDAGRIPLITETGKRISVHSFEGEELQLLRISRLHMGAYLCIASNGIPPSISRRILIDVEFPPVLWVPNQIVRAYLGERVLLRCYVESYPKAWGHWKKDATPINDSLLILSSEVDRGSYKQLFVLHISSIDEESFGTYECSARNTLGWAKGNITLYERPRAPTTTAEPLLMENQRQVYYEPNIPPSTPVQLTSTVTFAAVKDQRSLGHSEQTKRNNINSGSSTKSVTFLFVYFLYYVSFTGKFSQDF